MWFFCVVQPTGRIGGVQRAKLRESGDRINGLLLTKYLKNYAGIGERYVEILDLIISNNSLTDFDEANLLSTKMKKGLAL